MKQALARCLQRIYMHMCKPCQYPDEFKTRILALCPDDKQLAEALKGGYDDWYVGEMLRNIRNDIMSPHQIVTLFRGGRAGEVLAHAHRNEEARQLLHEWTRLPS